MTRKLSAALTAILFTGSIAWSQERWQADVRVRSVTVVQVKSRLTCKVVVYSDHDDDARQTTVRILMPVGVKFLSSATGCFASPSAAADGTQGVATCNIGTLAVGASRTVQIVTTVPTIPEISKTFGAFAWSITPDPKPANNYGEGTAP
jgi:hypothetical protein